MKTPTRTSIASAARNSVISATLLLFVVAAGLARAQQIGVTATFTGTQPSGLSAQQDGFAPRATQATSTQTAVVFGTVAVATATPPQLTATFTVTGFSGTFTPTAVAHYGLDYTVGTVSCTGVAPTETCTVPITFKPTLPGARRDALFLMNGTARLATVLIAGIGQAPMALTQPGIVSTLAQLTSSSYFYGATVDENGTLYVIQGTNVDSITKAGVLTTLPLTGQHPTGLAIDGAGVLYIANSTGGSTLTTYDTVQGIQGTLATPGVANSPVAVAVGTAGDVFALDEFNTPPALFELKPDGTVTHTAVNPVFTQPSQLAVDAAENVFIGGYQINELTAGGTQTNINTVGATEGLAVDAAETLYAARYFGVNGVAELAATDYTTSQGALDSGSPLGFTLGSDGTLYVSNYNQIDKVDRGGGVLDFGALFPGNNFNPVTTTIYNGGNQPLVFSNVSLTGQGFTFITVSGTNCATGTSIPPGASCGIGVTFAPTHPGTFSGSLTVTTNSLNRTSTAQTTTLTATEYGPYLTATVSPLNFPNQIVNTASAAVVETIANQGNTFAGTLQNVTSSDPAFTIDRSTCPSAVAAGSSCPISIVFTPTAVQAYSATITLTYYNSQNGGILTNTFTVTGTGIAAPVPQILLTPTSIPFPSQTVNTSTGSQTITVSNPGTGVLNISGITITGTGASSFAQTTTCGATVAAGASCTISVTFTPSGVASFSAAVNINDNASGSPHTVTLTGTGTAAPAPLVTLAPTSLTFPATTINTTSASQSITLTNTGNAALSISSINLAGTNPNSFATGGTCGASLAAGASCSIAVTFTPTAVSALSATVTVTDNATGSPHTATLSGTGTAVPVPVVALAPTSLTFAATTTGTSSAAQNITLTNTGNAALTISGISLGGANPTAFTTGGTCGASVAAGASCTIAVTFKPTAASALSATVIVTDNAAGSPHQASVAGTGVAPPTPQAVLSPTGLTFTSTNVGSTSAAQTITLFNPGTGPLSITGIAIGGTNAGSFSSISTCGTTLAAAASCSISVTFSPSAAGSLSASISVSDNAAASPHAATLAGTGVAPDFAITVGSASQTVSSSGGTAQYTFTAAGSNGTYSSAIAFSVTGLPTGVTAVFAPPSITPGTTSATTTLTVTVPQLTGMARPGAMPESGGRSPILPVSLAGLFCLLLQSKRRRALASRMRLLLAVTVMVGLGGLAGCGGGFRPVSSVAPGSYTLVVTGTGSTGQHSTNITLVVQ